MNASLRAYLLPFLWVTLTSTFHNSGYGLITRTTPGNVHSCKSWICRNFTTLNVFFFATLHIFGSSFFIPCYDTAVIMVCLALDTKITWLGIGSYHAFGSFCCHLHSWIWPDVSLKMFLVAPCLQMFMLTVVSCRFGKAVKSQTPCFPLYVTIRKQCKVMWHDTYCRNTTKTIDRTFYCGDWAALLKDGYCTWSLFRMWTEFPFQVSLKRCSWSQTWLIEL